MQIFDTIHNKIKSIFITLENNSANYKIVQKFKKKKTLKFDIKINNIQTKQGDNQPAYVFNHN